MNKIAFVFPGQGAQYVGMAKDFYDTFPESKEIFSKAGNLLGIDMAKLCFEENNQLNETEYTQIAMLTACMAIYEAVKKVKIIPQMTAGLSLGEYMALVVNGALNFEEAVVLVQKRGRFMANEVPDHKGTMAAVLGLENDKVEEICAYIAKEENNIVQPANYNCPGQIVISGEANTVMKAVEALKEAKAKRVLPLNVSGPFHSSMLVGAGKKLAEELNKIDIRPFTIPYVTNVTAEVVNDESIVKELLEKQISSSVKWQQSIENMIAKGITHFVEIGPGRTLSGFIKKIDKTVNVLNIEKVEDLDKLKDFVK